MTDKPRIVVTVGADGQVRAETVDIVGERCLDYIAVLEDLIGGQVRQSAFTDDYHRQTQATQERNVNRDVDPA
ncbi:DUF2997 domain-containing protein [Actinoplanes aureus]|jgi:hypothetical protein|uniref:DUF2997 domain-containing protein n=1 Tax=Actinoplanes aureus TaxID=2792083 RepID=A0A931CBJ5_9ACTN|nr:DUF2997 domain-containing protein [Actinoplanes aureus]MBG0564947.1 DUF2997 domain-containing protein [Actinoplanes aureus]